METNDAKKIVEALLFVAEQPVTLKMLEGVFDKEFSKDDLRSMIDMLASDYRNHASALEVREIAGGWQLSTKTELAPWIRKLFKDRLTYRLSPSAMETLSIIAYKQPITRGEIEEIRGVEVSAVIDTLMDRKLLRIVGRKETLGRPILFGTTLEFLRIFGLKRLEDLPPVDTLVAPTEASLENAPLLETPDVENALQTEAIDAGTMEEEPPAVVEPVGVHATDQQMEMETLQNKEGQEPL